MKQPEEGRQAYIAYKNILYDVTKSKPWKNGLHAAKHAAGNDLTDMLKNAPHGEEKVLALVFVITFIIALWRWW